MTYPDLYVGSIQANQLEHFAQIAPADTDSGFSRLAKNLWDTGESRPEWCFVASSEGEIRARVGYVGDIRIPTVLEIFDLATAWRRPGPKKIQV